MCVVFRHFTCENIGLKYDLFYMTMLQVQGTVSQCKRTPEFCLDALFLWGVGYSTYLVL